MRKITARVKPGDEGFTLVELVMAMLVMAIVMGSVGYVLTNSLLDAAYSRQRSVAINLANQTVEEVRALGWVQIEKGMSTSDPTFTTTTDPNITVHQDSNGANYYCFAGQPLDVNSIVGPPSGSTSGCASSAWADPPCLTGSGVAFPTASSLTSPQPLSPHQSCYAAGGTTYGVDIYISGGPGPVTPPLTATVVVSWARPIRGGLADHIVSTTQLSSCLTVNAANPVKCSATPS